MQCPSCRGEVDVRDWLCPFCEHILDPSVLGLEAEAEDEFSSARAERTRVVAWQARPQDDPMPPDAMILGEVDVSESEFSIIQGAQALPSGKTSSYLFYTSSATSRIVHPEAVPQLTRRRSQIPHTPYEDFLLSCVDGKRSVRDIQRASGLATEEVAITILTLLDKGAIRFDRADSGKGSLSKMDAEAKPPKSRRMIEEDEKEGTDYEASDEETTAPTSNGLPGARASRKAAPVAPSVRRETPPPAPVSKSDGAPPERKPRRRSGSRIEQPSLIPPSTLDPHDSESLTDPLLWKAKGKATSTPERGTPEAGSQDLHGHKPSAEKSARSERSESSDRSARSQRSESSDRSARSEGSAPIERAKERERSDRGDRAQRAAKSARTERDRSDRKDRAERAEKSARTERDRSDRKDRAERAEKNARTERDRSDRNDRAERAEKNARTERDRSDRNDRAERAEKNARTERDRSDRSDRAERAEKSGRLDALARPEKGEHGEKNGRIEALDKPERPEKSGPIDALQKPEPAEKSGRFDALQKPEPPEKSDLLEDILKPEPPEKSDRLEAILKPERAEKSGRFEAIQKPEKSDRFQSIQKPEKSDRFETIQRTDRPEKSIRVETLEQPDPSEAGANFDLFEKSERSEKSIRFVPVEDPSKLAALGGTDAEPRPVSRSEPSTRFDWGIRSPEPRARQEKQKTGDLDRAPKSESASPPPSPVSRAPVPLEDMPLRTTSGTFLPPVLDSEFLVEVPKSVVAHRPNLDRPRQEESPPPKRALESKPSKPLDAGDLFSPSAPPSHAPEHRDLPRGPSESSSPRPRAVLEERDRRKPAGADAGARVRARQSESPPPAVLKNQAPTPTAPRPSGVEGVRMSKAQKLYDEALKEKAEGNLVSARMNMKLALTFDPTNEVYQRAFDELSKSSGGASAPVLGKSRARELYDAATQAEELGEVDRAIELLEKALHEAREPAFYNRLGVIVAMKKRDFTRAQKLIETAIELAPSNTTYQHNLAKILSMEATFDVNNRSSPGGGDKKAGLLSFLGRKR